MTEKNLKILQNGGIGVFKTDTIYGILGQALNKKTVERIYRIKDRNKSKPFIILISSLVDLKIFDPEISAPIKKILKKYWPGKVSIILSVHSEKFEYLHRGTKSLAFRLPKNKKLIEILKKTGPLVAPSANLENMQPAKTPKEAKKYFGNKVDFYDAESERKGSDKPSKLIKIEEGKTTILRS